MRSATFYFDAQPKSFYHLTHFSVGLSSSTFCRFFLLKIISLLITVVASILFHPYHSKMTVDEYQCRVQLIANEVEICKLLACNNLKVRKKGLASLKKLLVSDQNKESKIDYVFAVLESERDNRIER